MKKTNFRSGTPTQPAFNYYQITQLPTIPSIPTIPTIPSIPSIPSNFYFRSGRFSGQRSMNFDNPYITQPTTKQNNEGKI